MNQLFDIFTREAWVAILGALVAITYAVVSFRFLTFMRERRTRDEQRFVKALDAGFTSGAIEYLNDVVDIYMGTTGISSEDLAYRAGLSKRLREYLVEVIEKGAKEDKGEIQKRKAIISRFIAENNTSSPYADLPDLERNIISDIAAYLESGNVAAVQRKVSELSSAIQAREDDLSRIRSINKWSVPLAGVGLVLTILFGVLSLIR